MLGKKGKNWVLGHGGGKYCASTDDAQNPECMFFPHGIVFPVSLKPYKHMGIKGIKAGKETFCIALLNTDFIKG
jgi:hypothetical protein